MTIEFERDPGVEPEINLISELNLRSALRLSRRNSNNFGTLRMTAKIKGFRKREFREVEWNFSRMD